MATKASELQLRVASALVLATVAMICIWLGGFAFALFVSLGAFLVFLEWTAIIGLSAFEAKRFQASCLMLAFLAALQFFDGGAAIPTLLLVTAILFFLTYTTTRQTAIWSSGAMLYCGLSAFCLIGLRDGEQGFEAIVLLFAIVWATDIGAYFVGRKIGGPKLAPKISPGKTQSGAVGGVIASMFAAGAIAVLTSVFAPLAAMFGAVWISIVSQSGDLFESYLKRRFGVKDSGSLVPGHGGLFDRVDGLMPAAIVMFGFSHLF